jgi:hypothetical protein
MLRLQDSWAFGCVSIADQTITFIYILNLFFVHCVFVVIQVATTFYIWIGFWALCFYCWSSYNKFLYILGLLGIVFLFLIKLQQVFIHSWAFGHCVSILDEATTMFFTSLSFWAFYFYCWSSCSKLLNVWCVGCFCGHWFFLGNLCCKGWKVLYKIDFRFLHKLLDSNVKMLNALVFAQLACEVCHTKPTWIFKSYFEFENR